MVVVGVRWRAGVLFCFFRSRHLPNHQGRHLLLLPQTTQTHFEQACGQAWVGFSGDELSTLAPHSESWISSVMSERFSNSLILGAIFCNSCINFCNFFALPCGRLLGLVGLRYALRTLFILCKLSNSTLVCTAK